MQLLIAHARGANKRATKTDSDQTASHCLRAQPALRSHSCGVQGTCARKTALTRTSYIIQSNLNNSNSNSFKACSHRHYRDEIMMQLILQGLPISRMLQTCRRAAACKGHDHISSARILDFPIPLVPVRHVEVEDRGRGIRVLADPVSGRL